jgi:hypothetical protein
MSAVEIIAEKVKSLSEREAKEILIHIAKLTGPRRWTAQELMLLPLEERDRILEAQMTSAAQLYGSIPELVWDVVDPPLDYE